MKIEGDINGFEFGDAYSKANSDIQSQVAKIMGDIINAEQCIENLLLGTLLIFCIIVSKKGVALVVALWNKVPKFHLC